MPIKFPKFSRRKSVGNSLEAAYQPANQEHAQDEPDSGSGFRVLQRNRGSGQTTGSSTFSYYGGSSNRLSSNSTLPSTDSPQTPDDNRPQHIQAQADSYHQAGVKAGQQQNTGAKPSHGHNLSPPSRGSTMSVPKLETTLDTSSLFGDDMFDFVGSKKDKKSEGLRGGLGSITPAAPKIASDSITNSGASHYDTAPAPPPKAYEASPTTSRFPTSSATPYANIFTSSHMDADRPSNNESSPYHWDTKPPEDLLSPQASNSPRNSRNLTPGQKVAAAHIRTDSLGTPPLRPPTKRNVVSDVGRRSPVHKLDVDAAIVAGSVARGVGAFDSRPQPSHSQTSPAAIRRLSDKSKDSGWEENVPSASSSDHSLGSTGSSKGTTLTTPMMSRGNTSPTYGTDSASNNTTPRAGKSGLSGVQLTDEPVEADFSAAAALAAKYENEGNTEKTNTNRVMTRAQFEQFQRQQDDQRRLSGKVDEDDSDESDYEEETDMEKNREIARLRARQEAHLSVYRQQMMKISGSDPSDVPFMNRGSMSTSALPLHGGMDPGSSGKNSDEEEDDDVPLGILMAHGFPGKNRPPTRLSNASSQPNLRATAQSQQLPVFARHLPQDPYNVGASLVNPMNRAPLSFHNGSDAMSNAGGSMYGGMPPSQPPGRGPGGLVGEIVRAEEQKAFRRGLGGGHQYSQQQQSQQHGPPDPFKQDPFDRPASRGGGGLLGNVQQHQGGMGPGMMGGQGMMGQGMMGQGMMGQGMMGMQQDQSQAQMAAMQQQYLQMQMQFMQMQMQMQGGQQPLAPPMSMMGQQQRPVSMMSMHSPMSGMGGLAVPQIGQQRAMSIMDPHFPQMQQGPRSTYAPSMVHGQMGMPPAPGGFYGVQPGYTPSIAPSERSTLGQPSRYRPVTYHQGPASVASSPSAPAGTQDFRKTPGPSHLKKSTTDSDDEDGWEELNKKRQEKADGWKKRKEGGLKGMLNFGSSTSKD